MTLLKIYCIFPNTENRYILNKQHKFYYIDASLDWEHCIDSFKILLGSMHS